MGSLIFNRKVKAIMTNQKRLKEVFDYKDGNLYWKIQKQKMKPGSLAGSILRKYGNKTDYWVISVDNKSYKAHRLIWMYHFGYLPPMIDHIDGDGLNNRIENLRIATPSQNSFNRKVSSASRSGIKNVYWNSKLGKWKVEIQAFKKSIYLGLFDSKEEAAIAAAKARTQIHGDFAFQGTRNDI